MRFSINCGQRIKAQPGLSGECPVCEAPTIAKCGEKNIWHWAHKGKRNCDHWWENETIWHRNWKNQFPVEWQEIVGWAENGEKHIADVKTGHGWVIEFQHSHIKPEERYLRENFYGKIVWVVDGLRRKNDLKQFIEVVKNGHQVFKELAIISIPPSGCRLVKEWTSSRAPIFFDFGDQLLPGKLWLLIPMGPKHATYVIRARKEDFIGWYHKDGFDFQLLIDQIKLYEQERERKSKADTVSQLKLQRMHLSHKAGKKRAETFQQYMNRKRGSRKRF